MSAFPLIPFSPSIGPMDGFPLGLLDGAAVLAVWDASDISTLFQDRAGTIPVTAPGQLVGMQLDKGQGLVRGPELVVNGSVSDDITSWNASGSAVLAHVEGGGISVTRSVNANDRAWQAVPAEIGAMYELKFEVEGNNPSVRISDAVNFTSGNFAFNSSLASGVFTAASNPVYLGLGLAANGTVVFKNMTIRKLPGLHKVAINDAARGTLYREPATGRRNLSNASELLSASVVSGQGYFVNISTGTRVGSSGVPNDDIETPEIPFYWRTTDTSYGIFSVAPVVSGETYTVKMRLRSFGADIIGFTSAVYASSVISSSGFPVTAAEGWKDVTVTFVSNGAMTLSPTGNNGNWGYVRFQVEAGDTATAYQKVTNNNDITEAGVRSVWSIKTDGLNTGYVTPAVDPGTDKVQVFAGVHTLVPVAAVGMFIEMSQVAVNNGAFGLWAKQTGGYLFRSTGTGTSSAQGYEPTFPSTSVISGQGDIANDTATLQQGGEISAFSDTDQGVGTYGNHRIYFYRRGGTTLPFDGRSSIEIVRFGPNLSPELIAQTERYIANKTGVTL